MTQQAKTSTIVSVLLHIIAFLVFAGVKIYSEITVESEMSVAFVDAQKEKLLRRSTAVRPAMSIRQTKQSVSQEQAIMRPRYKSNVVFYTSAPQVEFSVVKAIDQISARYSGTIHRPVNRLKHRMIVPMEVKVSKPDTSLVQMDCKASSGQDLACDIKPVYDRVDITNVLQGFADAVRRRIESKKRYPLAAQRSGISGEVGVRLTILRDGSLEDVMIAQSSGYDILDKAALGSVHRASPFPPIPEESGEDKVHLTISLVFEIT
jgi:TonB family protein